MKRIPVKSSNLASVGYDERTMTLEVEFRDGSIYEYSRVLKSVYLELMKADSKGKYFKKNVRDNRLYGCIQTYPVYKWLR